VFIPDKAHKQNFLHTNTKCVRRSEILVFRTSYPLFYIVVFREKISTLHTISVLFLFFCRIVSESNSYVRVRIRWNIRWIWIPANQSLPSFWRTKKNIQPKAVGLGF